MTTMHCVGLDLSLAATGWATIRPGETGLRHGLVPSSPPGGATEDYYPLTLTRLRKIAARVLQRIREGRQDGDPMVVAIEGPSYGNAGVQGYHARAGLMWILYHLIEKEATAVAIVPPASLKRYMTGNGNADKAAMVAAVQRAFPGNLITDDNEADALGLAAMVARQLNQPVEASVQRCHPQALNGVPWPLWIRQLHNP